MNDDKNFRVEDNYGNDGSKDWEKAIDPDGAFRDEPIYLGVGPRSERQSAGLSVEEAEELIDELANAVSAIKTARDAKLKELAEAKLRELPTVPGLYVPPNLTGNLQSARVLRLDSDGTWSELTKSGSSEGRRLTLPAAGNLKAVWGGMVRLVAVEDEGEK